MVEMKRKQRDILESQFKNAHSKGDFTKKDNPFISLHDLEKKQELEAEMQRVKRVKTIENREKAKEEMKKA